MLKYAIVVPPCTMLLHQVIFPHLGDIVVFFPFEKFQWNGTAALALFKSVRRKAHTYYTGCQITRRRKKILLANKHVIITKAF